MQFRGPNSCTTFAAYRPLPGEPDIELAVVPALGADTQGGRLGQGMGYYDRALPGLTPGTPAVAVVFHDELVEALPIEPHDVPVTAVVTERIGGRPDSSGA